MGPRERRSVHQLHRRRGVADSREHQRGADRRPPPVRGAADLLGGQHRHRGRGRPAGHDHEPVGAGGVAAVPPGDDGYRRGGTGHHVSAVCHHVCGRAPVRGRLYRSGQAASLLSRAGGRGDGQRHGHPHVNLAVSIRETVSTDGRGSGRRMGGGRDRPGPRRQLDDQPGLLFRPGVGVDFADSELGDLRRRSRRGAVRQLVPAQVDYVFAGDSHERFAGRCDRIWIGEAVRGLDAVDW